MTRYAMALGVVAAVGGTILVGIERMPDSQVASDVDDAVLVDLPPAIASSAPQRDVAEGPEQQAMAAAAPTAAAPAKPEETPADPMPPAPATEAQAPPTPKPPDVQKPDVVKPEVAPAPPVAAAPAQEETGTSGSAAPVETAEPTDSAAARGRSARMISRWQRSMLGRLETAKRGMHTGGQTGSVLVAFSIASDGAVVDCRVMHGSGSPRLDAAALALVRRAAPFPRPPAGLTGPDLSFKVPVVFARRSAETP